MVEDSFGTGETTESVDTLLSSLQEHFKLKTNNFPIHSKSRRNALSFEQEFISFVWCIIVSTIEINQKPIFGLHRDSHWTDNYWFLIRWKTEPKVFYHVKQCKAHLSWSKTHSNANAWSAPERQINGAVAHFCVVKSIWIELFWFWIMLWIAVEWGERNSSHKMR